MKPNKLSLFLFLVSTRAFAYDYQVSCAGNKLTKFENISVNQETDECKAFKSSGYLACFDSKKVARSPKHITLSTPNDHYYKSKESTRYSRKTVQEVVDSAIKNGNDPYLALATVVTENPPVDDGKTVVDGLNANESYASDFGTVPLDAIAVGDTMGCEREVTGYGANGMIDLKNRSTKIKTLVDDPSGINHLVCLDSFVSGQSASFYSVGVRREDECCISVKAKASGFAREAYKDEKGKDQVLTYPNRELRKRILDMLAHKYMQSRYQVAKERSIGLRTPEEKMAMTAQAFNGFGRFGVSEAMDNRCLHKVHMGTTPIYGAGTSEIMLNSLMNNSEVNDMVLKSLRTNKKSHPESQLCAAYGAGTHTVSGYAFTGLLGQYLNNRKACPDYSNKLKNLSKFSKADLPVNPLRENSPTNDADSNKKEETSR